MEATFIIIDEKEHVCEGKSLNVITESVIIHNFIISYNC